MTQTQCGCNYFPLSGGNVTFDAGVNVGVGTATPVAALDVDSSAAPQLVVRGGATSSVRVFPAPANAIASVEAFSASDSIPAPTNFNRVRLTVDGATAWLVSDAGGSGAALPLAFSAGGAERLRVTTAGNIGVGTSAPTDLLQVYGGSVALLSNYAQNGPGLRIHGSASTVPIIEQLDADGALALRTAAGSYLSFQTGGANEYMRIDGSGNIYLLQQYNSPGNFGLQIVGNGSTVPIIEQLQANGALILRTATNAYLRFDTSGAERMRIDYTGNVGIGTASPAHPLEVNGDINSNGNLLASGRKIADGNGSYYA